MLKGNRTFGNSKLEVIYAITENKTSVLTYKYRVIDKKIRTTRSISKFNCGSKKTVIDLHLKLISYCGQQYEQDCTFDISVNSKYSVYTIGNTVYCCSRDTFDKMIGYTKMCLQDSLALCNLVVSPFKSLKTEGIFENAKTGDKFETIDHRIAHYLYKYYANSKSEFHILYVEGTTTCTYYRSNGECDGGHHGFNSPKIIKKI